MIQKLYVVYVAQLRYALVTTYLYVISLRPYVVWGRKQVRVGFSYVAPGGFPARRYRWLGGTWQ